MRFVLIVFFLMHSLPSLAHSQSMIRSPMAYAETISTEYSLGDTGDSSGWRGCSEATSLRILCEGSMEVLVFGGHPKSQEFVCEFQFRQVGHEEYVVVRSDCQ